MAAESSGAGPNPAAALLQAATEARAHDAPLDPSPLSGRLAGFARAAESGDDARFLSSLVDASPALLAYFLSWELDDSPPGLLRGYTGDAFCRFLHTLELTPMPVAGPILEIGANPYLFHLLLRAVFPKASLAGTNFFDHDIFSTRIGSARHRLRSAALGETIDFEFPTFNVETVHPYPYPAGSLDVVYFCETLEHLVVNPLRVFREIRRVLRPGGHLVLTLPNAVRLTNVAAMLAGRNFFDLYQEGNGVHGRHNREFTLAEVRALLERDGYEIVRAETRDRFDYEKVPIEAVDYSGPPAALPWGKADLEDRIRRAGGTTADRGDNIYVVARRPAAAHATKSRPVENAEQHPEALRASPESNRLISFLDALEETPEGLRITGWAFFTDDASGLPAKAEIVLLGLGGTTSRAAELMSRPDVAAAHGLEQDEVGFTVLVPGSGLPEAPFEVRLRLRSVTGSMAERPLSRWERACAHRSGGADAGKGADAS